MIVVISFIRRLKFVGSSSQTPKDEGRGSGQPGEILGLKRPYDVMDGGISRGLPMRDSLSAANCEGMNNPIQPSVTLTGYNPICLIIVNSHNTIKVQFVKIFP